LRVTVDTNLLVYAADSAAGHRHAAASSALLRASHGDCVLMLQTLAEFFHVVTRKKKLPVENAVARIENWQDVFPVHAADGAALRAAVDAVRHHRLAFWDALLWAAARQAGCRLLLAEDMQDGRRLGSVTFVNPFNPANAVLIDAALPPADSDAPS
jgi:predicted nucleic acid-binding protein